MLIDTHCHIHEPYELPLDDVLARAEEADVRQFICVGTDEQSSKLAVQFVANHPQAFASVGVHPHEVKNGFGEIGAIIDEAEKDVEKNAKKGANAAKKGAKKDAKIVAVGEIGLDYFYSHSPREVQIEALKAQIAVALAHNLPIIFHVREAFDDFWPIFDSFQGIRGVLHSFTDSKENLKKALERGLFIGVNGISTFTKNQDQIEMFDAIPLDKILFETDAPFLTPTPYRGKINEPAYVRLVAEYHAERRGISLNEIAAASSHNARALFGLPKVA